MDLATKLKLPVQSKIYEKVGHRGIYGTRNLAEDTTQSLISISEENGVPQLDNMGRAHRITPIFQLLRRAKVCTSGDRSDYENICRKLPSLPDEPDRADYQTDTDYKAAYKQYRTAKEEYYKKLETVMGDIDRIVLNTRSITTETNMDRCYDSLTTAEIIGAFLRDKTITTQNGTSHFSKDTIRNIAMDPKVAMESENTSQIMGEIERTSNEHGLEPTLE